MKGKLQFNTNHFIDTCLFVILSCRALRISKNDKLVKDNHETKLDVITGIIVGRMVGSFYKVGWKYTLPMASTMVAVGFIYDTAVDIKRRYYDNSTIKILK